MSFDYFKVPIYFLSGFLLPELSEMKNGIKFVSQCNKMGRNYKLIPKISFAVIISGALGLFLRRGARGCQEFAKA